MLETKQLPLVIELYMIDFFFSVLWKSVATINISQNIIFVLNRRKWQKCHFWKNYPFKKHRCSILLSNFYCSIMSEFSLSFSRNSRQYTVSKLVFHSEHSPCNAEYNQCVFPYCLSVSALCWTRISLPFLQEIKMNKYVCLNYHLICLSFIKVWLIILCFTGFCCSVLRTWTPAFANLTLASLSSGDNPRMSFQDFSRSANRPPRACSTVLCKLSVYAPYLTLISFFSP